MKTNLKFYDYKSKAPSSCADHFDISMSSIDLPWTTILVEKGTAAYFSPQNVYSDVFMFTKELENAFQWEVQTESQSKTISTSVGSIWINSPFAPISHVNENPAEFLTLTVTPETLFKHYDGTVSFDQLRFITDYSVEDKVLESIMELFYQEALVHNKNGCAYVDHTLKVLANYFINNYSNIDDIKSGGKQNTGLNQADLAYIDTYIAAHLSEAITIDELAELVDHSKFHFLNAFKKHTGITPYQHIINIKIEKAKALLTNTSDTLVNIAIEMGFNDSSHFSRTFKKHTGVTPLKYRKSNPYV